MYVREHGKCVYSAVRPLSSCSNCETLRMYTRVYLGERERAVCVCLCVSANSRIRKTFNVFIMESTKARSGGM